jgi:hypothetical protein
LTACALRACRGCGRRAAQAAGARARRTCGGLDSAAPDSRRRFSRRLTASLTWAPIP